jgi:hypothetical protein
MRQRAGVGNRRCDTLKFIGHGRHFICRVAATLEHDPEKCVAVFRKDHAQTKS